MTERHLRPQLPLYSWRGRPNDDTRLAPRGPAAVMPEQCPVCQTPVEQVAGGWWCEGCQTAS